jgi:hypothetical protein
MGLARFAATVFCCILRYFCPIDNRDGLLAAVLDASGVALAPVEGIIG